MLHLPDITLVAATTKNGYLTAVALERCLEACQFGQSIFFSPNHGGFYKECSPTKMVYITPFKDKADASRFGFQEIAKHINTKFVLSIQWDGYIVNPEAWRPEFLDYDYIGATWPWYKENRVGNGGFCLRSQRLMNKLADMSKQIDFSGNFEDDTFTCRTIKHELEAQGMTFAPEELANIFSYERHTPDQPTFGFHGFFNMWRHLKDEELIRIINDIDDYVIVSTQYLETLLYYFATRKFKPLLAMYRRLSALIAEDKMEDHLMAFYDRELSQKVSSLCGSLLSQSAV